MSWWSRSAFLLLGVMLGSLLSHWALLRTTPEQLPGAQNAESVNAQALHPGQ